MTWLSDKEGTSRGLNSTDIYTMGINSFITLIIISVISIMMIIVFTMIVKIVTIIIAVSNIENG